MKLLSSNSLLRKYSHDRSIYEIKPSYVAFPKDEFDLREVVNFARKHKFSISPRGGGTGLSGAALGNGIIIDFTKYFNKVYKVDNITKVQSGILLNKLRPKVEKKGYMLPSVPLHGYCAIGGNVNTRSIGPRTLKYGTMHNQVKGIRGILSDEKVIDTSYDIIPEDIKEKIINLQKEIKKDKKLINYLRKRPLVAGGYYLNAFFKYKEISDIITHLVVGSVGTLLLLTEVELELPKYKKLRDLYLIHFKDFNSLQKIFNKLLKTDMVTAQYAGKEVLELWDKIYQCENSIAAIIVGFENKININNLTKEALKVTYIPESKREHLWKSRAMALPKLEEKAKKMGLQIPSGIDDTVLHPKDFSKVMNKVKEYSEKNNLIIASFGHIDVGSIHLRVFLNMRKNKKGFDKISRNIFKIVIKYNGTLVGEHNSGLCRSRYLEMENKRMYGYMKRVKKIFDPDNILNPKVMFNLDPITKNIMV